jgi:hypothetical protein
MQFTCIIQSFLEIKSLQFDAFIIDIHLFNTIYYVILLWTRSLLNAIEYTISSLWQKKNHFFFFFEPNKGTVEALHEYHFIILCHQLDFFLFKELLLKQGRRKNSAEYGHHNVYTSVLMSVMIKLTRTSLRLWQT